MDKGRRRITWGLVALVLLLVGSFPVASMAQAGSSLQGQPLVGPGEALQIQVQASTATNLILELTVPELAMEEVQLGGRRFVALSAPGLDSTTAPGKPSLPQTGALVGLPPAGDWSVRVLESEHRVISLPSRIAPAPTLTSLSTGSKGSSVPAMPSWTTDNAIYGDDAFFPSLPVAAGESFLMRDLRAVRLGLHPFRYNPVRGELEHIQRLVVEVRFEEPGHGSPPRLGIWDPILEQMVINYDVARDWRGVRSTFTHAAVNPAASESDSFKVEVDADGLYQITYDALQAAGFPVATVDPQNVHLAAGGQEIAVQMDVGSDGRFSPGDRILFYGQAAQGRFTKVNIYWLYSDQSPGLRMGSRVVVPQDIYPMPAARWITTHFEENKLYDELRPEPSGDHWYWEDLSFLQVECNDDDGFWRQYFDLPELWPGIHNVTLRTSIQGRTWGEHNLRVWVNEHLLGDIVWLGQDRVDSEFSFSATWLHSVQDEQRNEIIVENGDCPPPPPPPPEPNGMAINYFQVDHLAGHQALANRLDFWGEVGSRQYELDGFTTPDLLLYDITDPSTPSALIGARVEGGSRLEFEDVATTSRRYFAVAETEVVSPPVYRDSPSNLASASGGIDYLLIGYGDFLAATQPLVQLRVAQGLTVMSVDVQDVYDEFRYGLLDPGAIADFLAFAAAEWDPVPDYVLLVGDGTIDFHDHLGNGWHNYVPANPAYVELRLGPDPAETASDNELDPGEILPVFLIGRLPVTSIEQTETVVAKIVGYETASDPGLWNRYMLFVADNGDYAGPFPEYSDEVFESVSYPLLGERVYLAEDPVEPHEYDNDLQHPAGVEAARAAIRNAFAAGRSLVTYMGHSSTSQWAGEILLHRDNISELETDGRLPVMLSMTCYTGAFHLPEYAPLDEALVVEPAGGAVASWTATGAGVATGHRHLASGFFDVVQSVDNVTLGPAIYGGLATLYTEAPASIDLIDTYLLLGDPAMHLNRFSRAIYDFYLPVVARAN